VFFKKAMCSIHFPYFVLASRPTAEICGHRYKPQNQKIGPIKRAEMHIVMQYLRLYCQSVAIFSRRRLQKIYNKQTYTVTHIIYVTHLTRFM